MVLESLLDSKNAEKKPWELFFLGALYSSFALLLSFFVFKGHTSIVMISLTAICSVPLIYNTIKLEATKDSEIFDERKLIKEHSKAIMAFTLLFLGFVASFLFWFCVLPNNVVQNSFSVQISTITDINAVTGSVTQMYQSFGTILANNAKILVFCFLFSFFFGAGAIFILTWNASVVATAIGMFVKDKVLTHAAPNVLSYSHFVSIGLMKYLIHGVPEIIAYLIGGLAGGIVSIATVMHDYKTKAFRRKLFDALDIFVISAVLLVLAAAIEVFITAKLF